MKIINVLKDDSFEEILELFRQAPAGEVFLVLPRNGKLFRHDAHFAAFASEAEQGDKTVSIMTPNADTAALAKKFGFSVMPSTAQKAKKAAATKAAPKGKKAAAVLASAPPPADPDIREENDDAFSDVPMTSDATMGNDSIDSTDAEVDPLRNMHILDEEGNPVDENEDGAADEPEEKDLTIADGQADFVSAPAASVSATLAAAMDGVRGGTPQRTLTPSARAEKAAKVPVQAPRELDYIDAMWRDKVGKGPKQASNFSPKLPSFFSRAFSRGIHAASGAGMSKKVAIGILACAFLVLGSVVYATTGSAHITLTPVGKPLDTQITIQASDTFAAVDDTFLKLPGQLLEVSKTATNTVHATGKRDVASKARGKLTVTNGFSSTSQTLIATTRFQAANGMIYRTLQSITVPGSTVKAGATVPGTAVVDVIADKPGSEYNIGAGKFTIMAFIEKGDTEKAKQFYGVSTEPMAGGANGPSTVVTQADYDSAVAAATAAVKDQIKAALESQGPDMMVIDGDEPVMKEPQATAHADDAAEAVTVTATGTLKTVAFRSSDLQKLISANILKKDRLVVLPENVKLSYSDISFKPDLGTLTFTVSIKGTGLVPIDSDAIKREVGGMNIQRLHDYFKGKEGVLAATALLSPFWVRTAPTNPAKIDLELITDAAAQSAR